MGLERRKWVVVVLSVLLGVGAVLYWRWAQRRHPGSVAKDVPASEASFAANNGPLASGGAAVLGPVLGTNLFVEVITNGFRGAPVDRFAFRLTNSAQPMADLLRHERAVLLRNALIDTGLEAPRIPEHLRSKGDPGAYIVQARGSITESFGRSCRGRGRRLFRMCRTMRIWCGRTRVWRGRWGRRRGRRRCCRLSRITSWTRRCCGWR